MMYQSDLLEMFPVIHHIFFNRVFALHYFLTVVVRSTSAYKRLSGHPAGPELGWMARIEYPVPKHYTCQAVQSGFRCNSSGDSTNISCDYLHLVVQ